MITFPASPPGTPAAHATGATTARASATNPANEEARRMSDPPGLDRYRLWTRFSSAIPNGSDAARPPQAPRCESSSVDLGRDQHVDARRGGVLAPVGGGRPAQQDQGAVVVALPAPQVHGGEDLAAHALERPA